ncbi:porin [Leptothrix sp. BB-4]
MSVVAVLALAGPTGVQAQTSGVTVGGIADAGLRWVDNEGRGSQSSMANGGNATSRLIVRGTEELGEGLGAAFHLEHGLTLGNGTAVSATQFWDRRATVSLVSKSAGEVRLGRDQVLSYVNWSRYDPFGYVGVGGANTLISATPTGPIKSAFGAAANTTVRANGTIQWLLPALVPGLEGGLMWASRENNTAANGFNDVRGLRLGYGQGIWSVSAALQQTGNDLTATGKFKDRALGGLVDLGVVRLSGVVRQFSQANASERHLLAGAWVPVGDGEVKASVHRVSFSGRVGATALDANGATQLSLGYVHNLSKRAVLYSTVSRIGNRGAATYAVPGGRSGLAAGGDSKGIEGGMRVTF